MEWGRDKGLDPKRRSLGVSTIEKVGQWHFPMLIAFVPLLFIIAIIGVPHMGQNYRYKMSGTVSPATLSTHYKSFIFKMVPCEGPLASLDFKVFLWFVTAIDTLS